MNLREAYSSTALASLEWDENRERAVDKVAAAGRCSELGLAIWKARNGLVSSSYDKAVFMLSRWYRELYTGEQKWLADKIAEQSLYEFIFQFCHECGGAGEVVEDELKVQCDSCHGSRLKRYSDKERCARMQISWAMTKAISRKLQRTMTKIFDEDRLVNSQMVENLGRESMS